MNVGKPRILLAYQLFTGFEESVLTGAWRPTGSPAAYKLIDALAQSGCAVELFFTCKDRGSGVAHHWTETRDRALGLQGLDLSVAVLAGRNAWPSWLGRLRAPLREVRHVARLLAVTARFRPDVVYLDNANIWTAAILARLTRLKVVLRLMGVYPIMRDCLNSRRWSLCLLRWCYRSPFSLVLCGIDGSGGTEWMRRALSDKVPRYCVLNGVDKAIASSQKASSLPDIPANRTVILFIGKLEWYKGADTFLDAILRLRQSGRDVHAVMVGTGSMRAMLVRKLDETGGWDSVTMVDRLPHDQILAVQRRADVYVSLNHFGNLSNTNIEAMLSGRCMVVPSRQPGSDVDSDTDRLIPEDAVWRLRSIVDSEELAGILGRLADDPDERARLGRRLAEVAETLLWDWNDRIVWEMGVLRDLADGRAIDVSGAQGRLQS